MAPLTATTVPVTAAVTRNSSRRSRAGRTPSADAVSSPMASASSAPARPYSQAHPAATVTAASGRWAQVAPPRLPSSHIIADRAASPRAAPNTMTVVTASKPYASAVPVRTSRSGVSPCGERATA